MATELFKNDRLKTNCTGSLFFNPYKVENNLMINKDGIYEESGYAYSHSFTNPDKTLYWDGLISDYSIVAFGGQSVGFTLQGTLSGSDVTKILFPSSTYNYLSGTDISNMARLYDNLYIYQPIYNYGNSLLSGFAFTKDNSGSYTGVGTNANTDETNSIGDVKIVSVDLINNTAAYSHHSLPYNSKVTYKAKLRLPYKTPIYKIQQLLQSTGVVFLYDNRLVNNDYSPINSYYNTQKPLGGGCINPIGSSITIVNSSLTETYRRTYYEIEVIIEG